MKFEPNTRTSRYNVLSKTKIAFSHQEPNNFLSRAKFDFRHIKSGKLLGFQKWLGSNDDISRQQRD